MWEIVGKVGKRGNSGEKWRKVEKSKETWPKKNG